MVKLNFLNIGPLLGPIFDPSFNFKNILTPAQIGKLFENPIYNSAKEFYDATKMLIPSELMEIQPKITMDQSKIIDLVQHVIENFDDTMKTPQNFYNLVSEYASRYPLPKTAPSPGGAGGGGFSSASSHPPLVSTPVSTSSSGGQGNISTSTNKMYSSNVGRAVFGQTFNKTHAEFDMGVSPTVNAHKEKDLHRLSALQEMTLNPIDLMALKDIARDHPLNAGVFGSAYEFRHYLRSLSEEDVKCFGKYIAAVLEAEGFVGPTRSRTGAQEKVDLMSQKDIINAATAAYMRSTQAVYYQIEVETNPCSYFKMIRDGTCPDRDYRRQLTKAAKRFRPEKKKCKPEIHAEKLYNQESNYLKKNCARVTEQAKRNGVDKDRCDPIDDIATAVRNSRYCKKSSKSSWCAPAPSSSASSPVAPANPSSGSPSSSSPNPSSASAPVPASNRMRSMSSRGGSKTTAGTPQACSPDSVIVGSSGSLYQLPGYLKQSSVYSGGLNICESSSVDSISEANRFYSRSSGRHYPKTDCSRVRSVVSKRRGSRKC